MKASDRTILLVLIFLCTNQTFAQVFLRQHKDSVRSFRQMQRDFYEWKQTHDLNKTKGWKAFKRFEHETTLHTNGHGETEGVEQYLSELIRVADEKATYRTGISSGPWFPTGPNIVPNNLTGYMTNGIGRINCITFDPVNPSTFYVGVAQGGLWKTTNNGLSYTPLTDNLPICRISDIAIDPVNTSIIYISVCDFEYIGTNLFTNGRKRNTHYGLGVYKSTDGGLTWAPTGLSFQLNNGDGSLIRKILIDPNNTSNIIACGVSGMYKSANGGTTFTQVMDSLFWDMTMNPSNPNILYAATGWVKVAGIGQAGVYKSTNFGTTWTLLNTNIPQTGFAQRVKLAISPSNPNTLYALTVDTLGGLYAVYRSITGGTTWTMQLSGVNILGYDDEVSVGGQGNYDLGMAVDPSNPDRVIVGGINLWVSEDGAQTFQPASHWTTSYGPSIHADIHEIEFHPATGQFYVCHDGGIHRTANVVSSSWFDLITGGTFQTLWTDLSNGMNVTSFYRISSSKTTSAELIAGAQDNGSIYFDGTGWSTVFGGDGMDNLMDTTFPGTFIASSQYGNFGYTTDGGNSFFSITPNLFNENAEWTSPIVRDPSNYQKVYCGFENVVSSPDNGLSWLTTSPLPSPPNFYGNELSALAVSPLNSNKIWAARRVRFEYFNPGAIFLTTNGGNTWNDVTSNLPDSLYYTSLETDQYNGGTAYVSMAGFLSGKKVYKTNNNGGAWTNISYNLPNIPVNCVKQIPGTTDLLAATDIGVWMLPGSSTTWVSVSQGLPNVIVSDIEFNPAVNKAYITTFGRGIWSTDLSLLSGLNHPEQALLEFNVSPSVNNGKFDIILPYKPESSADTEIDILDIKGSLVEHLLPQEKQISVQLNTNSGCYFVRVRHDNKMGVKKIIINDGNSSSN